MTNQAVLKGDGPGGENRYSQPQLDVLIEAHERFVRGRPHGKRLSLIYLQAQGMVFSGRELTEADLTGAGLQRARLVRTKLERANLFCADLSGADARQANFFRADIRGVSLRGAELAGARLDEADMREAMLARADAAAGFVVTGRSAGAQPGRQPGLYTVDFSGCSMKGARLANAKLKGANFSGALLNGADLKGANLAGCCFDDAVVIGADLAGARLDFDALAGSVGEPSAQAVARTRELLARLQGTELWVETNGREGRAAVLDGEDLRPVQGSFAGRKLTALSAKTARAIGVSFAGAQLQGARFDGADLREADFTGADLRGASFAGANLRHARFEKADVRALPLPNGVGREVCLDGARMLGDCFARALRG